MSREIEDNSEYTATDIYECSWKLTMFILLFFSVFLYIDRQNLILIDSKFCYSLVNA